jgi:hypothetical protein
MLVFLFSKSGMEERQNEWHGRSRRGLKVREERLLICMI